MGNISCGGTGKSVVTRFLVENLKGRGAVILRGYKGSNEKAGESFLVSDGQRVFCDVLFAGDEAYMHARSFSIPVVIGKNRIESCNLLSNFVRKRGQCVDYVILDDGYQNYSIKKDLEILLLDAQSPFDNGHCLPAGRLREKDISRANLIILTRGDRIQKSDLSVLKKEISEKAGGRPVLTGRHVYFSLRDKNFKKVDKGELKDKKFVVFAGIELFDSFVETASQLGVDIVKQIRYSDHYSYSLDDIKNILACCKKEFACGALTTQKDWQKVEPLISLLSSKDRHIFYCLEINFEFLLWQERDIFFTFVKDKLGINKN